MGAILLGNGFSISYDPEMFSYDALVEGADFPDRLHNVFEAVGTSDFEHVMRRLGQARVILGHYEDTQSICEAIQADIDLVRTSLIQALTLYHPSHADLVPNAAKDQCATFLRQYDTVFTTNYDLLLYWVINPRMWKVFEDGFRGIEPTTWQRGEEKQDVHYLHGGLHLFRSGRRTHKRTYYGYNVPILDQLAQAMEDGHVPLFVSEGEWEQKLAAIEDSTYLKYCYDALVANDEPLTLFGFGFHENDTHIINAIAKSATPSLEVVLHTGGSNTDRRRIRERAGVLQERMKTKQHANVPLRFTESSDYHVWR